MPESLDIIKRIDDDSKLEIIQNRRESLFEGGKRLQGCMLNDKRHLHENIYQTPRSCICT